MEEKALEERRVRQLEEHRAAAGGIVVQGATGMPPPTNAQAPSNDPIQKLQQLKVMLDGGLITPDEYGAKKADILSRM